MDAESYATTAEAILGMFALNDPTDAFDLASNVRRFAGHSLVPLDAWFPARFDESRPDTVRLDDLSDAACQELYYTLVWLHENLGGRHVESASKTIDGPPETLRLGFALFVDSGVSGCVMARFPGEGSSWDPAGVIALGWPDGPVRHFLTVRPPVNDSVDPLHPGVKELCVAIFASICSVPQPASGKPGDQHRPEADPNGQTGSELSV